MVVLTNADIDQLRSLVAERLGLVLDDSSTDQLAEVLRRQVRKAGGNVADYLLRLGSTAGVAEIRQLADALTVGETYFFRHPDQFRAFSQVALPQRLAERDRPALHILSAGCASGEEAYSLAMLVSQSPAGQGRHDVRLTGIDVSPALLERAAAGRYSEWSLRATSPEQRRQYFRPQGRDYLLDEAIRASVTFQNRNLLEDDPCFWQSGRFDIIFFRNVAIYFARETTKAVIARMTGALAPGGFLFLGPSETLRGVCSDFHLLHTHGAFYYQLRRPGEEAPRPTTGGRRPASAASPLSPAAESPPLVQTEPDPSWVQAIHRATERIAAVTVSAPLAPPPPAAGCLPPAAPDLAPALELLRQERFQEAMAALAALPARPAADADALLLQAAVLTNQGHRAQAEQVCRQVLQVDELNAGAHYLLALSREQAGQRHLAAEHDQTAIYLDPAFAMPHLHLGMMTQRCGDMSTARRELQQALALLEREDASRILLFGGGFGRETLMRLCRAELQACGGKP